MNLYGIVSLCRQIFSLNEMYDMNRMFSDFKGMLDTCGTFCLAIARDAY